MIDGEKANFRETGFDHKTVNKVFAEANLALPELLHNNESIDDVFEALDLQAMLLARIATAKTVVNVKRAI